MWGRSNLPQKSLNSVKFGPLPPPNRRFSVTKRCFRSFLSSTFEQRKRTKKKKRFENLRFDPSDYVLIEPISFPVSFRDGYDPDWTINNFKKML